MRLVHEASGIPAKVGDLVGNKHHNSVRFISYFREPHKSSSEGKVSVEETKGSGRSQEFYVSVWGLKWIEREDRIAEGNHRARLDAFERDTLKITQDTRRCGQGICSNCGRSG